LEAATENILAEKEMKIWLEIRRFNPETDKEPHFQKFEVEAEPTDRLLDTLMKVKRVQDPSLALRKSCAHGVCGSDAMVINGKEGLACKTLVKDVAEREGATVRVEPLRTLPVERDLMVEQTAFFAAYRQVKPYLISSSPIPERERIQSPEDRQRFDDATKCILCAACYSACPIKQEKDPRYLGPAAIVQASRFIEDSRDDGFEERLPSLDYPDGIWPCESLFGCTRVCPRNIKVTKLINLTKRRVREYREGRGEDIHAKTD
jgi:succinate dehydrogenase / fumarate reductase iron-sulfur subunit